MTEGVQSGLGGSSKMVSGVVIRALSAFGSGAFADRIMDQYGGG